MDLYMNCTLCNGIMGPGFAYHHFLTCRRVHNEILRNPPLGYEPEDAANLFFQAAKTEVMASTADPTLFQAGNIDNGADSAATFARFAESVHLLYPDVVVKHYVWGYGRSLWDESVRRYGEHPLRVFVLGPAGSGKTTQCDMLSKQFHVPHINVGDLLYEEVKAKTALGLEAKVGDRDQNLIWLHGAIEHIWNSS